MIIDTYKRRQNKSDSISTRLTNILCQRPNNLHVTIYIQNQVLFQILPAKNFTQYGFKTKKPNEFVAVHFFNKNKTLTFDKLHKIKGTEFENDFYFFEEPKGNFNYIKAVGIEPNEIEKEIYKSLDKIYMINDLSELSIDYADY